MYFIISLWNRRSNPRVFLACAIAAPSSANRHNDYSSSTHQQLQQQQVQHQQQQVDASSSSCRGEHRRYHRSQRRADPGPSPSSNPSPGLRTHHLHHFVDSMDLEVSASTLSLPLSLLIVNSIGNMHALLCNVPRA